MATFNKENKITLKELAPSLAELINSKASQRDLSAHINNADMHVTPAERTKWNSALNDAKAYTNAELEKALGPIKQSIGDSGTSLTTLLNSKLDKSTFDSFRGTLARVATSGSYNDLVDQPSGLSYSDTANKALKAERATLADDALHAKLADEATHALNADDAKRVNGIRVLVAADFPTNPQNNKELFFHTGQRMWYCYCNNGWQMTGSALR